LLDHDIRFQTILIGMLVYLLIAWFLAQTPIRQAARM